MSALLSPKLRQTVLLLLPVKPAVNRVRFSGAGVGDGGVVHAFI